MDIFTGVSFALCHNSSFFARFLVGKTKKSLRMLGGKDGLNELLELLTSARH